MKTIRYYADIRKIVKSESEETDLRSVKEVLSFIQQAYGKEAFDAAKRSLIVVNDVSIGLSRGEKTLLNDGDTVGFLPISGGG